MSEREPVRTVVVADAADAVSLLLAEMRRTTARTATRPPLVGFATGNTFAPFLRALAAELQSGRLSPRSFVATHLDEYEGFGPDRRGGMVHELFTACPPLREMHARGAFVPVPCIADHEVVVQHERQLAAFGGVALQFAGIGRNGHVAFHEPEVPLATGFHVAALHDATRDDARARFAPDEVPRRAITAGVATILSAARVVWCAFGGSKTNAVRAALDEAISPRCPASALRRHHDVLAIVDHAAAASRGTCA